MHISSLSRPLFHPKQLCRSRIPEELQLERQPQSLMTKPHSFSAEFLVSLDNNSAFFSSLCNSFFVTGHKRPVCWIPYLLQNFTGISNEGVKAPSKQPLSQAGKSQLTAPCLLITIFRLFSPRKGRRNSWPEAVHLCTPRSSQQSLNSP